MDIDFKRTGNHSVKKWGIYTALLLCVTAAGIGSYAAIRKANTPEIQPPTAIDWENQGGTLEADVPATGVTVTQIETRAETQEETTQDNLPFTGSFSLPLGTEILKDYSNGEMVSSKTMGDWRVHNGIDFTGKSASEVSAIQRGTVRSVYNDAMWGVTVEVDHGNTMIAKYCGLKEGTTPKEGDVVARGATLGKLDVIPIEQADGYHLHLEISVNGTVVDPLAAMNRAD